MVSIIPTMLAAPRLTSGRFCLQDVVVIPGFQQTFNGESMMKLHNLAVQQVRPAIQMFENLGEENCSVPMALLFPGLHLLYSFFRDASKGFCAS